MGHRGVQGLKGDLEGVGRADSDVDLGDCGLCRMVSMLEMDRTERRMGRSS